MPDASNLAANENAPLASRLDGEVGSGLALFGGAFTGTPNAGFGLSDTARELRLGWRLAPAGSGYDGFELRLDAARRPATVRRMTEEDTPAWSMLRGLRAYRAAYESQAEPSLLEEGTAFPVRIQSEADLAARDPWRIEAS
ncbi:MAG: hypothetical protein OXI57_11850 [Rhodospirillales bacterium]|nr:hypothetical protein [Rhodospirillales bacterium]